MSRAYTHNGSRYAKAKARFKMVCMANDAPCHLCDEPIDYSLKFPHPDSFTLDHIDANRNGGDVYDPANFAPAHLHCNCSRGCKTVEQYKREKKGRGKPRTRPTRNWFK